MRVVRAVAGTALVAAALTASAAGSSPPQPTTPPDFTSIHSFEAAWSPDGRRLALARSDARRWPLRIVVMNADRSGARTIGSGFAPSWSPDGRRIVFVEVGPGPDNPRSLTVAAADRSGSHRLFRIQADLEDRPAWSPDGAPIAFRAGLAISVLRPDGRGLRLLIRGATEPDWSSDGRRLVSSRSAWRTPGTSKSRSRTAAAAIASRRGTHG